MREKILNAIGIFLLFIIIFGFCSYATASMENVNETEIKSMFIEVEKGSCWKVVYHRDTKVMYVMSYGSYSYGQFTVMVDSEGKPLLYEE